MPKIITIDCDNVLADTAGGFVSWYMSRTGLPLSIDQFDHQYLSQCSVLQELVDKIGDPYFAFWDDVVDPESMTEILPIGGSVEAIDVLKERGFECVMVTGRGTREYDETLRRVEQRFPGCFGDILFGHECTDAYVDKGVLCNQLGSVVHIDDFIQNAQLLSQIGIPTLLFDRSWNQSSDLSPLIARVNGREDSLAWIRENLGSRE